METIQVNNSDVLVLDAANQTKLDFYSLLKQVKKYSYSHLKKMSYFKIAQQLFLENELISKVKKQKEYKNFIKNNYIFGNVVETFTKFSDDEKLKELFFEILIANAYTKFDDEMNFDISTANDKMNSIVETQINQYFPNLVPAITYYQENDSEQDIKFFSFKNFKTYEFYYQWKRINAIIIKFFEQVGQKALGQIIAKLFLINYEALREMEDFSTTSLIAHENLSEDYVFETSNDLLKFLFDEMNENNLSNNLIKEMMMLNLSIVTSYQIEEQKKKNFVQRILQNKKSKEKFRLFTSSEIHDNLAQELKILSKTGMNETAKQSNFIHEDAIKINQKVYRFNLKDLKAAKNVFKNYDLLDFTTTLSETYFKARHLIFNKYYKHLEIIKLASLAYGYEFNQKQKLKMRDAQNIFEILILKIAYEISQEMGQTLEKAMKNSLLNEEFFLTHQLTTLNKSPLWAKYLQVVKEVYQNLNLNPVIAEKTIVYEILKNEDYALEKNKKAQTIMTENEIKSSDIINYQSEIIYILGNEFKNERINIHVKYTRFMTETFGKLYLSDKPPLTAAGKIGLVFTYLILLLWAVVIILPILQVLIQALNFHSSNMATSTTAGIPGSQGVFDFKNFQFGGENFDYLFKETLFSNWLINSIAIAVICMVLMVFITALIGYAFSRFRFKGKRIGLMSVMLIQMIPTVSSFVAFYIMLQLLEDKFGITGQVMLILVYIGGGIPGNVFVLKGYMDNISTDIDDAAKIDGCGNWASFIEIMLPLAKPMLSVIALWSFIGPFGDVLLPLVLLNDKSQYTMATGLQTLIGGGTTIAQGSFAAGSLIVAIPISLLFLGLQKNITGGLSAAGVKG